MRVVLWFSLVVCLVKAYSSVTDLPYYDGQVQDCTSSDIQAALDTLISKCEAFLSSKLK